MSIGCKTIFIGFTLGFKRNLTFNPDIFVAVDLFCFLGFVCIRAWESLSFPYIPNIYCALGFIYIYLFPGLLRLHVLTEFPVRDVRQCIHSKTAVASDEVLPGGHRSDSEPSKE